MTNDNENKPKKRGRKSAFSAALGLGVNDTHRFPVGIHALLKEPEFKWLMNWMAMSEKFKAKILKQVPDKEPPPLRLPPSTPPDKTVQ